MTTLTELPRDAEHIAYDVPEFSREKCTVLSGQNLVAGRVCKGALTAVEAAAAADTPTCIIWGDVNATAAAKPGVVNIRHTVVNGNLLTYAAGISGPQKTAQIAALAALGIIVR
jgi:Bacteriophage lambda head decoration protein D